jgi:hypothetical protein
MEIRQVVAKIPGNFGNLDASERGVTAPAAIRCTSHGLVRGATEMGK